MPTLRFKKKLVTDFSLEEIWSEFEKAFCDSLESKIWPNHLEVLRSEGLRTGNKVIAEYYGPFQLTSKRLYEIKDIDKFKSITYAPLQPHPFKGEARIEFKKKEPAGTEIYWSGEYHFRAISIAYLYFKLYFERAFFNAMSLALGSGKI